MDNLWNSLLLALCLMLIVEGVMPFLSPQRYRHLANWLAQASDASVRLTGLASMLVGLALMWLLS